MTTPNYVQVPPNSTGLKIDTSEVTTAAGNVVERQNVVIADPANPAGLLSLGPSLSTNALPVTLSPDDQASSTNVQMVLLLNAILAQLNQIGRQLGTGVTQSPFDYTIQ